MKNSFSLIETLIATLLLTITISTLLKIKDNNLFLLSSTSNKDNYNGLISIHTVSNSNSDENINYREYIDMDDDNFRKNIKDTRVEYKRELIDKMEFELDDIDLRFNIYQEKYSNKEYGNKIFYRVELN